MTYPNTEKFFPTYFPLHYQISENNSLSWNLLSRNSLSKKNYFPTNKQDHKVMICSLPRQATRCPFNFFKKTRRMTLRPSISHINSTKQDPRYHLGTTQLYQLQIYLKRKGSEARARHFILGGLDSLLSRHATQYS